MNKNIITISKIACNKIKQILNNENKKNIIFYVKGGGCNGFNYQLEPTNDKPEKLDEIIKYDNFNVIICNKSIMYLMGTNVGWEKTIMSEGFIFDNPMAKSKCGCGTSFNV